MAVIVPHSHAQSDKIAHINNEFKNIEEEVRKEVHKSLPPHMWPFWIFSFPHLSDIPVTVNGKLDIPNLVDKCKLLLNEKKEEKLKMDDHQKVAEEVIQIWKMALPHLVELDRNEFAKQHFLTLGGSSLSVMWCVEKIINQFALSDFAPDELRQELSTTMLHKPLRSSVELINSLLANKKDFLSVPQQQKPPFNHVTPASPLPLGKIIWYASRAGVHYCFICSSSSPSCHHFRNRHALVNTDMTKLQNSQMDDLQNPDSGILWRVWLAKCVDSSPIVVAREIDDKKEKEKKGEISLVSYVGSHKGIVVSVDCWNGEILWSCDVGARVESSPAVSNDGNFLYQKYVGGYDGNIFCINCSTGKVQWTYQTGNQIRYVDKNSGYVLVGSHDGYLHVISSPRDEKASSGICISKFQTNSAVFSSPIVNQQTRTIYFGSQDGNLYSVTSDDMILLWKFNMGAPIFSSPSVDLTTGNIFCGCCNGKLYALSSQGECLWNFQTQKPIYTSPCLPFIDSLPVVIFGSHDGYVYCLSRNDGRLIWKFLVASKLDNKDTMVYSSPNYISSSISSSTHLKLVACNTEGSVYILKWKYLATPGEVEVVKSFQLPKPIFSSPVWIDFNTVVVGCRNNVLYCLNTENT